jgi:type VI secretion system secreted protein Hcp
MAVDIFMQIPKVNGESTDVNFPKAIDVVAWNWGLSQAGSAGTGTGSGTGKVNVQDISFTKYVDASSPTLAAALCSGQAFATATLTMRKAGTTPLVYLVLTLQNVTVSGVSHSTSATDDKQTETISLHFAHWTYQYTPQNADGTGGAAVTMTWSIPGNSPKLPG